MQKKQDNTLLNKMEHTKQQRRGTATCCNRCVALVKMERHVETRCVQGLLLLLCWVLQLVKTMALLMHTSALRCPERDWTVVGNAAIWRLSENNRQAATLTRNYL
jgi:hypothetical protein